MALMIALPSALQALDQLDFANPKFYSGYIIQKTTVNCPGAFLASGRFKWNAPISSTDIPTQFFLMYYLIDTNSNNDCLRVIPGSHRKRHRLPDLPPQGTEEIRDTDESHPALQIDPDELNGEAGALVIGKHRLLHSAHPNRSQQRRTVVVLWFCPTYNQRPETVQAIFTVVPAANWTTGTMWIGLWRNRF